MGPGCLLARGLKRGSRSTSCAYKVGYIYEGCRLIFSIFLPPQAGRPRYATNVNIPYHVNAKVLRQVMHTTMLERERAQWVQILHRVCL